jgi:hypothetical protein
MELLRTKANPPPRAARAGRRLLPLWLVPAAAPVVVFADAVLGFRLLAAEDGFIYYLPLHILVGESIADGLLPAWNPFALSGTPLLALSQAGVFYPPNLLFAVLPPFVANNVTLVGSISIAAVGTFFLARRLTQDAYGAVVAGVAFASCGFVYGHLAHQSIIASAAWIPWTLLAYERARARPSAPRVGLVGASLALSLLAGHAQMFSLSVLVLAVYAITLWVVGSGSRETRRAAAVLGAAFAAAAAVQVVVPEYWPVVVAGLVVFVAILVALVVKVLKDVVRVAARGGFRSIAPLWIVAGATVLSLALSAVQLAPNLAVVGETIRVDLGYTAAMAYSFPASHLALLPFPYLFGNPWQVEPFTAEYLGRWNLTELAGYPGAVVLVLALSGTLRLREKPAAVALLVVGVVALLIALGGSTAFGLLVWATPVLGDFRSWGRAVVVVDLVIALLAAYGVAHLRNLDPAIRRSGLRRAYAGVAAFAAAALVLPVLPSIARFTVVGWDKLLALGVPLLFASLALVGAFLLGRRQAIGAGALALLVVVDGLLGFGAFSDWRLAPSPAEARAAYSEPRPPFWGPVSETRPGPNRYLFAGRSTDSIVPDFPHVTSVKGVRSANGYEPLPSARYATAVGAMTAFGGVLRPQRLLSRRWLFDLLGVSVVLVPRDERTAVPQWLGEPRFVGGLRRYDYVPRLPASFLVTSTRTGTEADVFAALESDSFDARTTAIVERRCDVCRTTGRARRGGEATPTRWDAGAIDLRLSAEAPSLVVVSEAWFPGWSAEIDGRPAEVLRANGLVLGVPVPAGARELELRYRPPGLGAGAFVSALALLALLATAALALRDGGATRNGLPRDDRDDVEEVHREVGRAHT